MDQTIAYFAKLPTDATLWRVGCGYIKQQTFKKLKVTDPSLLCTCEKVHARFLCEMNTNPAQSTPTRKIQFPKRAALSMTEFIDLRMTSCRDGHVTHEFLACDVQSACWARARDAADFTSCRTLRDGGRTASGSCAASLTPLPPSFPCSSGWGEVPYTLVCDHRDDCSDGSDEQFCVFPRCDGQTQFDCGNRQVRW